MPHSHRDMTHSHVRHASFTCESRQISTCSHDLLTQRHDSFTFVTWLIHMWDMTHAHRDMTHSHVRHDSFTRWDMTQSHVGHDSFTQRHDSFTQTWLGHTWDMTHMGWLWLVGSFKIPLFCRILSLFKGSFAKETYNFIDTNRSHPP